MEENKDSLGINRKYADNIFFAIVGCLIIGIYGSITSNWVAAICYGAAAGAILWLLFKAGVGEKIVDFMMMFFAWCGGVPRADIEEMSAKDQLQYARTGATLFVPTTLAFAGAFFVASDVYHLSTMASCVGATIWATIIFTIDAALVSTMKRDREMKYPKSSLIIRCLLALALGVLISSVLELRVFQKEIKQEFEEELEAAQHSIDSTERVELGALQSRIDRAASQVDAREMEMRKEIDQDVGGRKANYGPVAKKKEKLWEDAKADFEQNIRPALQEEMTKVKAFYMKKRARMSENFSDGLASRLEYLSRAGEKHPTIQIAHFFLFLFLIALELVPVLAKMMAAPTEYEHKKAQITADAEVITAGKIKEAQDAQKATAINALTIAGELEAARQRQRQDLETQRINAIIRDMDLIDESSKKTGRPLDNHFDVISNRLIENESSGNSWFWKKKGYQPVA